VPDTVDVVKKVNVLVPSLRFGGQQQFEDELE
jgi:hypothetical protein